MHTKNLFIRAALVAAICLAVSVILLNTLPPFLSSSDGLAVFGILVALVAGIFTIWGLYWAATTFAESRVEPDLTLLISSSSSDTKPLSSGNDALVGITDSLFSGIRINLFIENSRPKAAQLILVVLRIKDSPSETMFKIEKDHFEYAPKIKSWKVRLYFFSLMIILWYIKGLVSS